jgi:hypothetical protein
MRVAEAGEAGMTAEAAGLNLRPRGINNVAPALIHDCTTLMVSESKGKYPNSTMHLPGKRRKK